MICTIEWNTLSLPQWEERFATIRRSPLLQSYDYARAVCPVYGQKARWGLIKIDDMEAGLVQIQEAALFGQLFHAVILDRGPMWFENFGSAAHIEAFFKTFHQEFPRRFGRRRRIIPETDRDIMPFGDYKRLNEPGYQTIWLDLTKDSDTIRAGFKQKWRNILNKAEKTELEVEWDMDGLSLPWLLSCHEQDKVAKHYQGASPKIIKMLSNVFKTKKQCMIGRAMLAENCVAAILIFIHGSSATYQIGWTSAEGKKTAAHNLLLWQAVLNLKSRNIKDFDLGGINEHSAQGVKKFKEGLGGDNVTLCGRYI